MQGKKRNAGSKPATTTRSAALYHQPPKPGALLHMRAMHLSNVRAMSREQ